MYLKRIELQGFKSFADKTILDLKHGITSVIGPNGSGKTSFMEAMNHYYKYAGYGDAGDYRYLSKNGNIEKYDFNGNIPECFELNYTINDNNESCFIFISNT